MAPIGASLKFAWGASAQASELLELVSGSAILLAGALLFTNSVERLGEELGLTKFATGALLAAGITALPEAALALGSAFENSLAAQEVGEGSVIASPSLTLLAAAPLLMLLSSDALRKEIALNYLAFALLLPAPVLLGLFPVPRAVRLLGGLLMVGAYAALGRHLIAFRGERMMAEAPAYLEAALGRRSRAAALAQAVLAVLMMYVGVDLFLFAASRLLDPFLAALALSPFATCMEETLLAVFWTLKGKVYLGLSLLSGENLIQSTLVVGAGMVATEWALPPAAATVLALYLAAALLYALSLRLPRPLPSLLGFALYAVYIAFNIHGLLAPR